MHFPPLQSPSLAHFTQLPAPSHTLPPADEVHVAPCAAGKTSHAPALHVARRHSLPVAGQSAGFSHALDPELLVELPVDDDVVVLLLLLVVVEVVVPPPPLPPVPPELLPQATSVVAKVKPRRPRAEIVVARMDHDGRSNHTGLSSWRHQWSLT
jgi:hypothetical protein